MKVYEAIAAALAANGVDTVFGVMGEGNLELIAELDSRHGVRYVAACHEAGAVAMADGFSRVSGRVGVCTVTQGPGFANAIMPLVAAGRNGSRLLLVAADTPAGELTHPQRIDQDALARLAGAESLAIEGEPGRAAGAVVDALELALAGAPAVLRAPTDVQKLEGAAPPTRAARPRERDRARPDPGTLATATELAQACERPVVVAGRGAVAADARRPLEQLAERLGALLATSLQAKGFFAGHPASIGVFGGFCTPLARELLREADAVLAFGASLNSWQTRNGELTEGRRVLQFDADPQAIGALARVDCGVVGDAAEAARALLAALGPGDHEGPWSGPLAAPERPSDRAGGGRLDPELLMMELEDILPRNRTLVVDGGHFTGYPCTHLSAPDPAGFVFALDFGSTGLGLATAIGAGLGRPERVPVLVVGDGGLMMAVQEIDTAVRYGIPMVIVVANDSAYGSEVHHLRIRGLPERAAFFPQRSFERIATALGARAVTVAADSRFDELRSLLAEPSGPVLVDALIDGDVLADWFEAFARRAATAGRWT